MNENAPASDRLQASVSTDAPQSDLPESVKIKLDKCDTLVDLLEENGTSGVSSKETTSEATAYPEFGSSLNSGENTPENTSLEIRICTTEIAQSTADQLTAGTILTMKEPVHQMVELRWQNQLIGSGHLHTRDNYYVIEIASLHDAEQQGHTDEL